MVIYVRNSMKIWSHSRFRICAFVTLRYQVRKEWKVKGAMFGKIDGRVTYVLDKNGVVTSMYDNLLDGAAHSREALKALGA